ncbi:MAG: hypothetical protein Aurels2KO_08160 [Aureliella sp.]
MRSYLQHREASAIEQYEINSPNQPVPNSEEAHNTIRAWHTVDGLPKQIAQFESVFWEPDDTNSLRKWLTDEASVNGARILEVGTGTGLVAIYASLAGASEVVATDVNASAVANARYNAMHLDITGIDFRLVATRRLPSGELEQPGPYTSLRPGERFDFILSNPPWEDNTVEDVAAYALYDTNFALLDGLLNQSQEYLRPGGQLLLAYGATEAIKRITQTAPDAGWSVEILDDRELEELPEVFLPAMLLRLQRTE